MNEPNIDIGKYIGKWNEIAAFPQRFQKGCMNTTATYTNMGKYIEVSNQCIVNGKTRSVKGKAFPTNKANLLKVQFIPLLSFPIGSPNYKIEYVDPQYQHAIIGNNKKSNLWILSRNPKIETKTFTNLVRIASQKGYDTTKLQRTQLTR